LLAQDAVLLSKIIDDLQLALIHPARQPRSAGTGTDPEASASDCQLSPGRGAPPRTAQSQADQVFGPYAVFRRRSPPSRDPDSTASLTICFITPIVRRSSEIASSTDRGVHMSFGHLLHSI
jgi:hypothetical protein